MIEKESKAKRLIGPALVVGFVVALVGAFFASKPHHSGVFVNKKELTVAQVETGRQEIHTILNIRSISDLQKVRTTSPISGEFRRIYIDTAIDELNVLELINKGIFTNFEPGMTRQVDLVKRFAEYDRISLDSFDRCNSNIRHLQDFILQVDGKPSAELAKAHEKFKLMKNDYLEVQKVRTSMLNFVFIERKSQEKNPPNPNDPNELSLDAQKHLAEMFQIFDNSVKKLRSNQAAINLTDANST